MNNDFLTNLFGSNFLLMLFRILLIILSGFYVIFSFVVIRQISIMKKTLITPISFNITLLGWVHFGFAFMVFLTFLLWVKP